MILRGMSRPMGLLFVFVAAFFLAVMCGGPLALLPVLFEEPKAVEGYFLGFGGHTFRVALIRLFGKSSHGSVI